MNDSVRKQIAEAAVAAERSTGCPAELLYAQCALESGWLNKAPGNNCFGIKAEPDKPRQLLATREWFTPAECDRFLKGDPARDAFSIPEVAQSPNGRSCYHVLDWFAAFPSLAACFAERARLFFGGPYRAATLQWQRDKDIARLVRTIGPIYATDPGYAKQVLEIIGFPPNAAAIAAARAEGV